MPQRPYKLLLLALIVLLQGAAPLLHGHIGGQQIRVGFHVHLGIDGGAPVRGEGFGEAFRQSETPEVGIGPLVERRLHVELPTSADEAPVPSFAALLDPLPPRSAVRRAGATQRVARDSLPPPALAPPARLA